MLVMQSMLVYVVHRFTHQKRVLINSGILVIYPTIEHLSIRNLIDVDSQWSFRPVETSG